MTTSANAALVIIDAQVAMFTYEGMKLHDEEAVLERLAGLANRARAAGTPVVFIQHTSHDGDEFQEGSDTWELHPALGVIGGDIVVRKPTCDAFHETDLHDILQERNVGNLVIAGMQTDFCVDTTSRRAFSLGYDTVLVRDAHSTFDRGQLTAAQIVAHHNSVLGSSFVRLLSADDIVF
ncbi:cysteine hydrolase family protein [Cohnella nanjingensis]|uniref:Cysteine hydrolase n=1 Tax=Cohnella nanjingensis TaxID=1387779 RepID=A0A7X0RW53_9BACL|nr:cysteine hydrolase family protein [Cohnella nanjingensis]MBB6674757.1 cysteine hydrolase [Cohnella nanjingensis]